MKIIRNLRNLAMHIDQGMLLIIVALASIGLIMMGSASMDYAAQQQGNPLYYLYRQSFFLVIAVIAAAGAFAMPTEKWNQFDYAFLLAAFVLLVLVVIPGIGREVNGSMRWIPLGPFNLQSSEPAKLFVLIYMAGYLVRRRQEVREKIIGFIKPAFLLMAIIMLLMQQPDFGAAVVVLASCFGMIFLAGLGVSQLLIFGILALTVVIFMAITSTYRLQRLSCFIDPWAYAYDCGYQLTQSLIAFGRGEFFGLGIGKSIQKLFYLPEAHTDFVYAIIAEELGFVGSLLVLVLFAALIGKIFQIGRKAEVVNRLYSAYLTYGIGLVMAIQVFVNIGVNTGILPTKGLTLPFISYGGSSLIVMFVMMGIVLRIDAQMRSEQATSHAENMRAGRLA